VSEKPKENPFFFRFPERKYVRRESKVRNIIDNEQVITEKIKKYHNFLA